MKVRPIVALLLLALLGTLIYSQWDQLLGALALKVKELPQVPGDATMAAGEAADLTGTDKIPVEPDPARAEACLQAGIEAYEASDFQAAETNLRDALRYNPALPLALDHLGLILSSQGKIEEAREMFVRSVAQDSTAMGPLVNLISANYQTGRVEEAFRLLAQAERLEPGNPAVQRLRGVLEKKAGNKTE